MKALGPPPPLVHAIRRKTTKASATSRFRRSRPVLRRDTRVTTTACHILRWVRGGRELLDGATAVRLLEAEDIAFAAKLHAQALPQGFFVLLGPRFLRAYYRGFRASPYAIALVAERDGERIGVLVGTLDSAAHHRYVVRRHGWRLAVLGAAGLVLQPRAGQRFLRTRALRYARSIARAWRPGSGGSAGAKPGARLRGPLGVLSHVAVATKARGTGAGTALLESFVVAARRAGTARVELVTLAGSEGAASFYERLSWHRAGEHVRDGIQYTKFSLDLP